MEPTRAEAIPLTRELPLAIVAQLLSAVLASMLLDGGDTLRILCGAAIAYWAMAALLILRSSGTPSLADRLAVRWGFLPIAVVAFVAVHLAWGY